MEDVDSYQLEALVHRADWCTADGDPMGTAAGHVLHGDVREDIGEVAVDRGEARWRTPDECGDGESVHPSQRDDVDPGIDQCEAETADGDQCENDAASDSEFCGIHQASE